MNWVRMWTKKSKSGILKFKSSEGSSAIVDSRSKVHSRLSQNPKVSSCSIIVSIPVLVRNSFLDSNPPMSSSPLEACIQTRKRVPITRTKIKWQVQKRTRFQEQDRVKNGFNSNLGVASKKNSILLFKSIPFFLARFHF